MTRVVVDPGVFISALIGPAESPPGQIVDAWLDERVEIVVSPELLDELRRVALRPKFHRWFEARSADELIARVERLATIVHLDAAPLPSVTRDPADDYLVALARTASVDAIVTGDRNLHEAEIDSPQVLSPAALVRRSLSQ